MKKFFEVIILCDPHWEEHNTGKIYTMDFPINLPAESQEDLANKICGKYANYLINGWIAKYTDLDRRRRVKYKLDDIPSWLNHDKEFTDWFMKFLRESKLNSSIKFRTTAKNDMVPLKGKLEGNRKNNGLISIQIKAKENPKLFYWIEEDGKWKQISRIKDKEYFKESIEDNFDYDRLFVEKVVNFDSKLIKICTRLYESFGVDFDINEEGEVTLKAADGCINESQSLLDAKEYVKSHLDDDEYTNILFI